MRNCNNCKYWGDKDDMIFDLGERECKKGISGSPNCTDRSTTSRNFYCSLWVLRKKKVFKPVVCPVCHKTINQDTLRRSKGFSHPDLFIGREFNGKPIHGDCYETIHKKDNANRCKRCNSIRIGIGRLGTIYCNRCGVDTPSIFDGTIKNHATHK